MNPPEGNPVVVDAATGVVRNATPAEAADLEDNDGVISEPSRWMANILWSLVVLTLCAAVVALVGTFVLLAFTPKEPESAIDSATLVAVFGTVLASLVGFYSVSQRR